MKKRCLSFVLLFILLLTATAANAGERWRLVSHAMPGTSQFHLSEIFCNTVEELSGGELIIEPFAAGVLFPVFDSFDNVANGVIEISMVYGAYWNGKDSLFNLTTRPGCPIGTYAEAAYLDEALAPITEKLYAKYGIKYLGHVQESPINEQLMSVVPINSIDDIKGKKIRTAGIGAQFYRALGATTVSLSAPEIYTAFQTKNVDAAEWTYWDDNLRMGFNEVALYVLDPALHNGTNENLPLTVNPAKWEALPQRLKDIVLAARDRTRYYSALIYVEEIKAREAWKANKNITFVQWSPEDVKKAREIGLKLVIEEGEKSQDGKEYVRIYRDVLWELGYKEEAQLLGYEAK
ncbi:MAG: TRAP transporter substrate-binding protein [Synergistaceae bacterium]|jgi:TRAP-type mannitol/chloroaromatic compound transport system substrate-binding protein|nr:TRAP transporter substrate-binding protein [Synergistaceae bacterium]